MLKLTRKTEYALLALRYLARLEPQQHASVRQIAEWYAIPDQLLAKVMQSLKAGAIIASTKGHRGGYRLAKPLDKTPLLEVLGLFRVTAELVDCLSHDHTDCAQQARCDIKGPLAVLNHALLAPLTGLTLADLFAAVPRQPATLTIFGQAESLR